jgi:hypothetical protein
LSQTGLRSLNIACLAGRFQGEKEMREPIGKFLVFTVCVGVTSLLVCSELRGQDPPAANKSNSALLRNLQDSVKALDEEIRLLQHFLEASTVDPRLIRHGSTKSWVISNPELRDSLFYALVAVDSSVQSEAGAEAEVLATESNDVMEVRFGTAVFKGEVLREALAKSSDKRLYEKVAGSYLYSKHVELRNPAFKLPTVIEDDFMPYDKLLVEFTPVTIHQNPQPEKAKVDLSLYGLIVKIGPSWGGEVRVGSDEVGFPFWTSGKTSYLVTYKRVKIGIELPFRPGLHATETFPPFSIRSRKLNGTRGTVGEFDFGPVGGFFSFTRLTDSDMRDLTNPDDFACITRIVQAYYSFGISLTPSNLVRVKIGAGYHGITEARLVKQPLDSSGNRYQETVLGAHETLYPSPYVKLEYINKDMEQRFGGSLQYYDYAILTTAWLEIVPRVLSLEVKLSAPILRDPRKWEDVTFVMISPHISLSF